MKERIDWVEACGGSRRAKKLLRTFRFVNSLITTKYWPEQLMSGKRKNGKDGSSISSVSDGELRSPDEKKVREVSVSESGSLLDSSSDEILNALGMTENLTSKIDCVLAQMAKMDKKLEQITSSVSSLEKKFDKLDSRVYQLEANQSKTRVKVKEMEDGLNDLNRQVNELNSANEKVKENCEEACTTRYKALEDKLLYAEVYSRRENLRFYGIHEEEEQEDSLSVLKSFLESKLEVDSRDIEFQRVHRVGKVNDGGRPRPIIARFLRYSDREFIFSKARDLKETGYGISADLPREIVRRRKELGKKLSDARKDGKRAFFSRVEPDKLYVDGELVAF